MDSISKKNRTFGMEWGNFGGLKPSHYIDNRIYRDPNIFEKESAFIFKNNWRFAIHTSEIPNKGDYRTIKIIETSIILVRENDNVIKGFVNICPHRGARLIRESAGHLENKITCLYHHWSFNLRGECTGMPLPHGYDGCGVCADKVGLKKVHVAIKCGLVFVCLGDPMESLEEYLDGTLEEIAETISDLEVFHYHKVNINANWKQFVETNCEGYHEFLHLVNRSTGLAQRGYKDRKWVLFDRGHSVFTPMNIAYDRLGMGNREDLTLPGLQPNHQIVVDLFPDTMLNVRSSVVRIDTLIPISPEITILECRGLAPKIDNSIKRRFRIKQHNQIWGPMGRNLPEDILAIEGQFKNMGNEIFPHSLTAREDDNKATDDAPIRHFYRKWEQFTKISSANIDKKINGEKNE